MTRQGQAGMTERELRGAAAARAIEGMAAACGFRREDANPLWWRFDGSGGRWLRLAFTEAGFPAARLIAFDEHGVFLWDSGVNHAPADVTRSLLLVCMTQVRSAEPGAPVPPAHGRQVAIEAPGGATLAVLVDGEPEP
jgi:hypothetical protein